MEIDFGHAYKKENGNIIKITMNEFHGQIYVHIREYALDGDTNFYYPTKSGYALKGEEVDSVIEKLEEASDALASLYKPNTNQLSFDFFEEK